MKYNWQQTCLDIVLKLGNGTKQSIPLPSPLHSKLGCCCSLQVAWTEEQHCMEEMEEGKFYFFLLKSVRPGSDANLFMSRTWIKHVKSSTSESIRNTYFNLEQLSHSSRLPQPGISTVELLWNSFDSDGELVMYRT